MSRWLHRCRLPALVVVLVMWAAITPARAGEPDRDAFRQEEEAPPGLAGAAEGGEPGQDATRQEDVTAGEPLPSRIEERVTVEAEGVADIAAFATVVDTEEIASRGEDLAAVLRRVPGARVRQYGGFGQYATLSLRSSTAEQVTIQVDGIPQNRALGGAVDLSFLPATQLQSLTVYRGFAPAASGSAGLGGLVDIRTRVPGETPEGDLRLLGGELDSRRAAGALSFRTGGRWRHGVSGEWLQSEGDFLYLDTRETPFNPDDDVTRTRDNNNVEHTYALWQSIRETESGELALRARVQARQRGLAGVSSRPATQARLDEDLADLSLAWTRRRHGVLQSVSVLADGFRQEIRFQDPEGELGARKDQTTTLTGGGLATTLRWWKAPHRVLARLELRHEEADVHDSALAVPDRGGARRDQATLSLEDVMPLGRWTLAPSLRAQWRRDRPEAAGDGTLPGSGDEIRDARASARLGVAFALNDTCALRGSAGNFFRNPNLVELFGDRGFVAGNPSLRPERGESVELGAACARNERWSLEAVGFARRVRDLIQFLPVSLGVAKAVNLAAAEITGVELSAGWTLPAGFRLEASGTLQDARDDSGGPADGEPLVFQPRELGWFSASWRGGRFGTRWDVTYVGENSTDRLDTEALRLPTRIIHDLLLSHVGRRGLRLSLDVRNIFDRRTLDVQRYPLPGRTVFAGMGWRWGGEST
ncbi:MAG: TonB-dependent receptor [Acidobacteria bacterium]|nr:MAG: TonB-dependent receptor [Acidobacteriota bacterium]